jgi:hypothetical protein
VDAGGWRRKIPIALDVHSAQTSCGFSVPVMAFQEDRETLKNWARRKGEDGIRASWLEANAKTIDGIPTGMTEALDEAARVGLSRGMRFRFGT